MTFPVFFRGADNHDDFITVLLLKLHMYLGHVRGQHVKATQLPEVRYVREGREVTKLDR